MTDQPPPDLTPEQQREIYFLNRREGERIHDDHREFIRNTNKAAVESSHIALRSVILINGGAAVSMLAFIGGLAAQKVIAGPRIADLAFSLMWFASGVAAGTLATGFAYFTNLSIVTQAHHLEISLLPPYITATPASGRWLKVAGTCRWIAVAFSVGSVVLFVAGIVSVWLAVQKFQ